MLQSFKTTILSLQIKHKDIRMSTSEEFCIQIPLYAFLIKPYKVLSPTLHWGNWPLCYWNIDGPKAPFFSDCSQYHNDTK
jgi:hypothetical protein